VLLKYEGLVAFLSGIIIAGIPITISSSNSGSAWDNSKKIIEGNESFIYDINPGLDNITSPHFKDEYEQLVVTESYDKNNDINKYNKIRRKSIKNAIIGDNIGDAFKDISGPAINILIKFSAYFCLITVNYLTY
jgi:Na+/H+-translocating membrane pyrophosphatase